MVKLTTTGSFENLKKSFQTNHEKLLAILDKYGEIGVAALREATPKATGKTSESWVYKIAVKDKMYTLSFHNTNVVNGVPIAIVIQYGHGTNYGGYVEGIDYINPTMKPIFDSLADKIRGEVAK